MAVKTLGARHIVAKAASELHGAILERVGAERVVYPEQEAGARVAHVLGVSDVLDYLDVGPEFGIARIRVPAARARPSPPGSGTRPHHPSSSARSDRDASSCTREERVDRV